MNGFVDDCGYIALETDNYVDISLGNMQVLRLLTSYIRNVQPELRGDFEKIIGSFFTPPLSADSVKIRVYKGRIAVANSKDPTEDK